MSPKNANAGPPPPLFCPTCQTPHKEKATACPACGLELGSQPFWTPRWSWHGKALLAIYASLIVVYFLISFLLKRVPEPYRLRDIPPELTPWIKK